VLALILDDSKTTRMILRRILSAVGFEVIEAGNGLEGLHALAGMAPPDLVAVDWEMPEMDGLAFVRAVRRQRQYDSTQLVMVSTNNNIDDVATALDEGANEYIMKPFSKQVVREKLDLLGISHQ
jgi:two-component system chemotaxis response regulator CheY